ncbi:MAG: YceI family protein [Cytophagales bacterium]|nr:YceI family protein [Cytophagales bacterium]
MKPLFLLAALLPIVSSVAQSDWKPQSATVKFSIRNAGIKVNGTFGGFGGTIRFDPAQPGQGQIEASVDARTIDTGINARDNHLRKAEYFDVASHPRITLKSVRLAAVGTGKYNGVFQLTLKGVAKEVEIPFTFTEANGTGVFAGSFKIDRRTYDVGGNSWVMGDEVTIDISMKAVRQAKN